MDGAIRPIDQLFWMTQGPAFVIARGVTGIGACRRIAPLQSRLKRSIADLADEAAVADGFEFSVPTRRRRQPHLETDMRIARGRGKSDHAAKGWEIARSRPGPIGPAGIGITRSGGGFIAVAEVTVALGILREVRLSQDRCAAARPGAIPNATKQIKQKKSVRRSMPLPPK